MWDSHRGGEASLRTLQRACTGYDETWIVETVALEVAMIRCAAFGQGAEMTRHERIEMARRADAKLRAVAEAAQSVGTSPTATISRTAGTDRSRRWCPRHLRHRGVACNGTGGHFGADMVGEAAIKITGTSRHTPADADHEPLVLVR